MRERPRQQARVVEARRRALGLLEFLRLRGSLRGGIHAIEVTLRTPAAPDAIRAIAAESPQAAGGVDHLRSLGGPLLQIRFCPTGGITAQNASEYLRLPTVVCVGGSWLTPSALMHAKDWPAITALARAAAALRD